jgi:hypothetical protein
MRLVLTAGLADLGEQPLDLPDALQDRFQPAFGGLALPAGGVPRREDFRRHNFHLVAGRFQLVGQPVENRVHQADKDRQGIGRKFRLGRKMLGEAGERLGIDVADRHEDVAGEDEAHWISVRLLAGNAVQHRCGHEQGAVTLVEPARRLDLGHFLARRHILAECLFRELFLLAGGVQQVHPDGAGRNVVDLRRVDRLRGALRAEQAEHCGSLA